MKPVRIVLQHFLCPGDTVVMTTIPRELYRAYPGKFEVSVRTAHPDVWTNNPFIVHNLTGNDQVPPGYELVELGYNPRDEQGGSRHFMHSYLEHAGRRLEAFGVTELPLTEFRPYLRLTDRERQVGPSPDGIIGGMPYWLFMAGGKEDISTKWWDPKAWQQVIYTLASNPKFPVMVQVGKCGRGASHPVMRNCVNLLDKTSLRELIWLTYHSRGVICGVTGLMHIAAALRKPCVVIAGGREAWWWDSYDDRSFERHKSSIPQRYHKLFPLRPRHVYLDTVGKLPCCRDTGCWKLGIGEKQPDRNCVDIVRPVKYSTTQVIPQPRCMTMIRPEAVVRAALALEGAS